jgi:hypothetical protein
MPYFKNDNFNILFIHIPKTGGTSIENYFLKKMNFNLSYEEFPHLDILIDNLETEYVNIFKKNNNIHSSLQHMTYYQIINLKNELKIDDKNNLEIISVVRNPYDRIISDLFYFKLIEIDTTQETVYNIIIMFLSDIKYYDNHNLPQYQFLIDENGKIPDRIHIFKTETLTQDLINYGYLDFNLNVLVNTQKSKEYSEYLNRKSVDLINEFYSKDFELFNYKKI